MNSILRCSAFVVSAVVAFSGFALGEEPKAGAERFLERSIGFAYDLPPDWKTKIYPGQSYRLAFGPVVDGFMPNIVTTREIFAGTLEAYVDAVVESFEKQMPKFRLHQRSEFKTTAGEIGARVEFEAEAGSTMLRYSTYIFRRGEIIFILTCGGPASQKGLEAKFEKAMATFRFER